MQVTFFSLPDVELAVVPVVEKYAPTDSSRASTQQSNLENTERMRRVNL